MIKTSLNVLSGHSRTLWQSKDEHSTNNNPFLPYIPGRKSGGPRNEKNKMICLHPGFTTKTIKTSNYHVNIRQLNRIFELNISFISASILTFYKR